MSVFYMAICRECNAPPNRYLPIPFYSEMARNEWADEHEAATDHEVLRHNEERT